MKLKNLNDIGVSGQKIYINVGEYEDTNLLESDRQLQ